MSQIPATAGEFLTENRLRAYTQCSEFWNFGGEIKPDIHLQVTKYVFEYLVSSAVRKDIMDPMYLMNRAAWRATKELEIDKLYTLGQAEEIRRTAIHRLNEATEIFKFSTYFPVFGPFEWDTKIHKTPVRLQVSGLFRSKKNQTLHVVCWSPYNNDHAAANDPTTHIKLQTLKNVVAPHNSGRAQCRMHIFGLTAVQNLFYTAFDTSEVNNNALKYAEKLIETMESGYHFPVLPCKYNCPYKSKCYITKEK